MVAVGVKQAVGAEIIQHAVHKNPAIRYNDEEEYFAQWQTKYPYRQNVALVKTPEAKVRKKRIPNKKGHGNYKYGQEQWFETFVKGYPLIKTAQKRYCY